MSPQIPLRLNSLLSVTLSCANSAPTEQNEAVIRSLCELRYHFFCSVTITSVVEHGGLAGSFPSDTRLSCVSSSNCCATSNLNCPLVAITKLIHAMAGVYM